MSENERLWVKDVISVVIGIIVYAAVKDICNVADEWEMFEMEDDIISSYWVRLAKYGIKQTKGTK